MTSSDKEFAAATIQAIGRCASNIAEVTDTCLNGLVLLMSNRDGRWTGLNEIRFNVKHRFMTGIWFFTELVMGGVIRVIATY